MPGPNEEGPTLFAETPALDHGSQGSRPPRQRRPRRRLTQRERVLAMLRDADEGCGSIFYQAYIPRFSVQIHALRKAGFVISKRPCDLDRHDHEGTGWLYKLEAVPDERDV